MNKAVFLAILLLPNGLGSIKVNDYTWTSIINLIASPEKFDSKRVYITGYYVKGAEKSLIFLTRDLSEIGNGQEAVWVNGEVPADHYVELIGTFHTHPSFDSIGVLDHLTYVRIRKKN
jgi:hypothetical protein